MAETQSAEQGKGTLRAKPDSFVMVVEDDEVFRWLLTEALKKEGFEVLTAVNGKEALELYREKAGKVWLVVSDVIMPGMDGLTAAMEMRKVDDRAFFIFMSGYDSARIEGIGVRMEDIPRSEFFRKPFAFKDMAERIRTLEREKAAGS